MATDAELEKRAEKKLAEHLEEKEAARQQRLNTPKKQKKHLLQPDVQELVMLPDLEDLEVGSEVMKLGGIRRNGQVWFNDGDQGGSEELQTFLGKRWTNMEPETDYLVHITCVPSKDAGKPVKNKTPKVYYCLRKHVITGIEEEVLTLTSLLLSPVVSAPLGNQVQVRCDERFVCRNVGRIFASNVPHDVPRCGERGDDKMLIYC